MFKPSYVHCAGNIPLQGKKLEASFDEMVERFFENKALFVRHQKIRWTYRKLKEKVDRFVTGLFATGLKPGDFNILNNSYFVGKAQKFVMREQKVRELAEE